MDSCAPVLSMLFRTSFRSFSSPSSIYPMLLHSVFQTTTHLPFSPSYSLYTARNPLSKAASTAKKEEAKAPPSQQVKEIAQTDKDPNEEFMSFGGLFSTEKSSVSSQAPVQPKTASPSTKVST